MKIFEHLPQDRVIKYLETCTPEDEIYNCTDDEGNSLLHVYSGGEYSDLQDFILEEYPPIVHAENESMETPIFSAIVSNNLELVKKIIAIDASVLVQSDISGRTPIFVAFASRWCSIEICELLWELAPHEEDWLCYYKTAVETSFQKSKFIIDNTPGVFDMSFAGEENILHATMYVRSIHAKNIIKYIYEKSGTALFAAEDSLGSTALHHAHPGLVKLIYSLYPESVYHKDKWGNIPLCYSSQNNGDILTCDAMEIIEKHPELLEYQNNNGKTLFMKNMLCPSEFFRINPASFTLRDKRGNNSLHHICLRKNIGWWKLVDEILQVYPELLFQANDEGDTPLDIGIGKKGYSSQQRSKERFIAVCLKYSELPGKYWIFDKISFDLISSMGNILARSRSEAAKAMKFLPQKDKEIIQNIIIGMNHIIEPEILTSIISRMYN
jgi:ankyrin repeat protein